MANFNIGWSIGAVYAENSKLKGFKIGESLNESNKEELDKWE